MKILPLAMFVLCFPSYSTEVERSTTTEKTFMKWILDKNPLKPLFLFFKTTNKPVTVKNQARKRVFKGGVSRTRQQTSSSRIKSLFRKSTASSQSMREEQHVGTTRTLITHKHVYIIPTRPQRLMYERIVYRRSYTKAYTLRQRNTLRQSSTTKDRRDNETNFSIGNVFKSICSVIQYSDGILPLNYVTKLLNVYENLFGKRSSSSPEMKHSTVSKITKKISCRKRSTAMMRNSKNKN